MKSIRQLYKAGIGPSSSHSMGPKNAALRFKDSLPHDVSRIQAELYGSLAATGKGHLTDKALEAVFGGWTFELIWRPDVFLPHHPCGLRLKALDQNGKILAEQLFYSIGGGDLADQDGKPLDVAYPDYPVSGIEDVLAWCRAEHQPIWQFADQHEGVELWDYLRATWKTMCDAIGRGLMPEESILPGGLNLARRAPAMMACANERVGIQRDLNLLAAYALAVSEENAAGHTVVTAPTCGSCGIVPAVLYYFEKHYRLPTRIILQALATAGVFGSSVAKRASISGAEIGCQGEVGTACAMAAAAATQLLDGTPEQIEYAAEMALEHMLGLTCDPINGLVQIPCIERNAVAAMRAVECASYALATDGRHRISFDEVVEVMKKTGLDLQSDYKETALGGLARIRRKM